MNAAQLTACRQIADELHGSPANDNLITVRTAVEMALVPHSLSAHGRLATEPNGNCWGWSNHLQSWVLYETVSRSVPNL